MNLILHHALILTYTCLLTRTFILTRGRQIFGAVNCNRCRHALNVLLCFQQIWALCNKQISKMDIFLNVPVHTLYTMCSRHPAKLLLSRHKLSQMVSLCRDAQHSKDMRSAHKIRILWKISYIICSLTY